MVPSPASASLVLRPLRGSDRAQALQAHAELTGDGFSFLLDQRPDEPWDAYVARLDAQRGGGGVPAGWVPHTLLVGDVDGTVVGRLSVRHRLTPWLAEVGGHIGYAVRPALRGRGHATAMLRASLPVAAAVGLDRVLVTCDETNPASARVIEKCGGVPDGRVRVPDAPTKLRYWVAVPAP